MNLASLLALGFAVISAILIVCLIFNHLRANRRVRSRRECDGYKQGRTRLKGLATCLTVFDCEP